MAKKNKAPVRDEKRTAAEYYKLNTKAVDDLISADESNSPEVSEAELRRYTKVSKLHLPDWLKIALIKAWFAGAVCFFLIMGTSLHVGDQIIITGIALGFVWDLLVNNLLRFMEKTKGANDRWILFSQRSYISLPLNALYGLALIACVVATYEAINTPLSMMAGDPEMVTLPVEPVLFGMFTMGWDSLFLLMKRGFKRIVSDAKKQVRGGRS